MGDDLCKSCEDGPKDFNEKNLVQTEEKKIDRKYYKKSDDNKQSLSSIKTPDISTQNPNFFLEFRKSIPFNYKKKEEDKNSGFLKEDSVTNKKEEESNKIIFDESKLNEIINNYRIKVFIGYFKRFIKIKERAFNKICFIKNLQESKKNISIDLDIQLEVDLFPEETYDYLGNFFIDRKEGFGIQYFNNTQSKYTGKFTNNKRIGWCEFEDKTKGYSYKGETSHNLTGEYGLCNNYKNGNIYEGEWLNNRKEGYGIETFANKSVYQGEFHKGFKHGIGKYKWSDGSIYEGELVNNSLEGYGIIKFKGGTYCAGIWKDNQINGFGKFYFPDVKCYIGFFKQDVKSGFGLIYWFNKEKVFIGFWKDNKQDGLGKFISNNDTRYGVWSNGRRTKKFEIDEFNNKLSSESEQIFSIFQLDYNGLKDFVHKFDDI